MEASNNQLIALSRKNVVNRNVSNLEEMDYLIGNSISNSDGEGRGILHDKIKCALINARSIVNKVPELEAYVYEMSPDVILITESWTRDDVGDAEIALKGYNIIRKDRRDRTGGGCLLFVREHLNVTLIEDLTDTPLAEAI